MVNPDIKDKIIDYLIKNHEHLKNELHKYTQQKNDYMRDTDAVFHADIKTEYLELARTLITKEIAEKYAIAGDQVLIVLDSFNLERYLE